MLLKINPTKACEKKILNEIKKYEIIWKIKYLNNQTNSAQKLLNPADFNPWEVNFN